MKKVISGNQAVSYAVRLAKPHVIAAYPITPQSTIVEMLAGFCAGSGLKAKFINVESEHSAMAACIVASVTGVTTFTATSSQGLALMHEMLHYVSGLRLPIVMANVNRALASPFNLKADLSDSLSQRDTGWIQFYCESSQEVFDTILQGFRIAEEVLLPVMVNLEGFILSHTYEVVDMAEQDEVDRFLPAAAPRERLDVNDPSMFDATTDYYIYFRYRMQEAMERAKAVAAQADRAFRAVFGRGYDPVTSYRCEDAEIILVSAGTIASSCRLVADRCRAQGQRVGVLGIRLFRPLPRAQIVSSLRNGAKVAVIDRDFSPGLDGILAQEIRSVLHEARCDSPLYEFIAGLGGKDVTDEDIEKIIERTLHAKEPGEITWIGLLDR